MRHSATVNETWPDCAHQRKPNGQLRPLLIRAGLVAVVASCAVFWWLRPSASAREPATTIRREAASTSVDPLGDLARKIQVQQAAASSASPPPAESISTAVPAPPADRTSTASEQGTGSQDDAKAGVPAAVGENFVYLQLASFRLRETADQVAAELVGKGLRAVSVPYGMVKGEWWHAVRVGPYGKRIDAEKERLALSGQYRDESIIVPRTRGSFHIRAASFQKKENAERLSRQLCNRGHRARVLGLQNPQISPWFGVYIGAFETRQDAVEYLELLQSRDAVVGEVVSFAAAASQ